MPKTVDYPHCSFEDALMIANIVNKVGGKAPLELISDELKMSSKGGAFVGKINGATKYGMLIKQNNELLLTDLGDMYFHPIKSTDRDDALYQSFLSVTIFKELVEKFHGKAVEKNTLISVLIRMYGVNRNVASKVAWYFLKATSKYGFLQKSIIPNLEENVNEELTNEENIENEPKEKPVVIKNTQIINSNIFNLIMHLGNLLFSSDENNQDSLNELKKNLELEKENLSHSELFIDLLDVNNKKIFLKLEEALKKDFNIKESIVNEGEES